jgi:hypothetical protein
MRRVAIFTAGAALVVGSLAIPGVAVATGKTTTPQQSTTVSAQSASLDSPIEALGKRHGKGHGHGKSGYRKGYRRGYRHGYSDGRFGYGYYGYGYGYGYGYWPVGYGHHRGYWPVGYGYGFWPGGFGCNFDYPCGPPYDEQCRSFWGVPSADPRCRTQTQPAPGQSAQPTPDTGTQPAPAPEAGTQPAPAPAAGQGDTQPRPY